MDPGGHRRVTTRFLLTTRARLQTSASIPALGYGLGAVPELNLNPLSGSYYQTFPIGYESSIWNNSYDDGTWAGTDVFVSEADGSPFSNSPSTLWSYTLVFESVSNSSSFLFTESGTSYWVSDVPTTSGEDHPRDFVLRWLPYSFTHGSDGTADSTGGSGSFWGGGQSDTESGISLNFDGGLDNSTSSSMDGWQDVDSQYSGSNVEMSPGTPATQYYLSDGIASGSDSSDVGTTSVSTAGSTSQTSINLWTHSSSSFNYTAGQNEVNNVNSYGGGGSGSDSYRSSWTSGTDTSNGNSTASNDYTITAGSSTSESDHYSDTLSYDGQGHSLIMHNLGETVTGNDESSTHTDGENTLSGYPETSAPITRRRTTAAAIPPSPRRRATALPAPGTIPGAPAPLRAPRTPPRRTPIRSAAACPPPLSVMVPGAIGRGNTTAARAPTGWVDRMCGTARARRNPTAIRSPAIP